MSVEDPEVEKRMNGIADRLREACDEEPVTGYALILVELGGTATRIYSNLPREAVVEIMDEFIDSDQDQR